MKRAFAALLPLLFAATAFAQSAPEPPAEKASMFTVVLFLLGFVGAVGGYFVYLWVNHRKTQREGVTQK